MKNSNVLILNILLVRIHEEVFHFAPKKKMERR